MDLTKIEAAQARRDAREHATAEGNAVPVFDMRGDEDRALLLDAVSDLLARIRHLEAFERGDLVPGVVVSAHLAAAKRWADEACAPLCEEIERIKMLAREGWETVRDIADEDLLPQMLAGAVTKLAEIGNPPARPVETIDLRIDPEVQDTIRKATAEIERLEKEVARLKAFEPKPPRYTCGDNCPTCSRCMGCGYCKCPATPTHPDDKPAPHALPSDAFAGVP